MTLLPRAPADASLIVDLARIVGASGVSTADADRFAYARDCWPRDLMRVRAGEVPAAPSCVVWPESADEVARVLDFAQGHHVPIVPFGAGSGVAGGGRPSRGGITLDLKRMKAIRVLDEKNLRAEVECGVIGERLERTLNEKGYTLGHFPSSIVCSTLGGWIAARSAGQASTLYGKIEDMTLGLEVVSPGRVRRQMLGPRPARGGPDWNALVTGSEGTFAVITAADLRIRPLPEARHMRGFRFPSVEAGLEAIRRMLRANVKPAVVRLYDALDTFMGRGHGEEDEAEEEARSIEVLAARARGVLDDLRKLVPGAGKNKAQTGKLARGLVRGTVRAVLGAPVFLNRAIEVLPEDALLILGFEGHPALVQAEAAQAALQCEGQGATDLGPGPGEHWLKNRYNMSFKQSKVYASGAFVDTMEVAATWDRLLPMYKAVRKSLAKDAFVMAHFSHAYAEGCSIYFTLAGPMADPDEPSAALARYDRLWKNALAAVHETGGTASHHHGVGELKADAMAREHGPGGARMLNALKHAFDPKGIMNPGKLGLEETPPQRAARFLRERKEAGLPKEIRAAVGERNLVVLGSRTEVRPPDENALAAVLRVAHTRGIPVYTDQAGERSPTGAVHVDLSRLSGITRLSTHSLFVEVEGGLITEELEGMLNRHGLTMGALHPRAMRRTIGAALARNLLVRRATAFGDLEDPCFAVRGLLANGAPVETRPVPRSATGPELDRALVGAQGRWGIITRATLRVAITPPIRESVAYTFPTLAAAAEHARLVLRRGVRPCAGRVLSNGTGAFELAAHTGEVMRASRAIVATAAERLEGKLADPGGLAAGGRFDAVVEAAVRWTQAAAGLEEMKSAAGGEAWIDFLAPEEAVLVARVVDKESRRKALDAAVRAGGRVLAGSPTPEETPYDDIAERVAAELDPNGVFRVRGDEGEAA